MTHHPQHAMLTALDAGFGVVGIASVFMVIIWARIAFSGAPGRSSQYRIVSWGLFISSLGILFMASDRILGRHEIMTFEPTIMLFAAILVLVGKALMISSTAYSGDRRTFYAFLLLSLGWVGICVSGLSRSIVG